MSDAQLHIAYCSRIQHLQRLHFKFTDTDLLIRKSTIAQNRYRHSSTVGVHGNSYINKQTAA